jgi:aspartate aminotransferase
MPDVIKSIKTIVINDLGTNVVSQRGAIAALKSKKEWLGHIKNTTRSNQDIIKKAVSQVEGAYIPVFPSDGNMLAIDIHNTGVTPLEISEYLLNRKVFTREGSYTSKLLGERYLRVSFSIPPEHVEYFAKIFIEGMAAIKASK